MSTYNGSFKLTFTFICVKEFNRLALYAYYFGLTTRYDLKSCLLLTTFA